jgi:hypothetical protein
MSQFSRLRIAKMSQSNEVMIFISTAIFRFERSERSDLSEGRRRRRMRRRRSDPATETET